MGLFAILMVIDFISGITRAALNDGFPSIKSSVARRGIVAKLLLILIIFGVGITSVLLGYESGPYVQATITVLSLGELYSIIGNVHSSRTGEPKVEFDAVALILKRLKLVVDKIAP